MGRVLDEPAHIISTGGGSILSSITRKAIKSKSFSIWVQCNVDIISKRIHDQEKRPLLKNKNILDTLIKKNRERVKFYRQADSHIVNENSNIEMTAEAIIEELLFNKVIHK